MTRWPRGRVWWSPARTFLRRACSASRSAGPGILIWTDTQNLLVGGATLLKQAMVVFGGTLATEVDASTLVAMKRGQVITTLQVDGLGASLGGGHDVNRDVIDDVVLGAPFGEQQQGSVLFGDTQPGRTPIVPARQRLQSQHHTAQQVQKLALQCPAWRQGNDFTTIMISTPQF